MFIKENFSNSNMTDNNYVQVVMEKEEQTRRSAQDVRDKESL